MPLAKPSRRWRSNADSTVKKSPSFPRITINAIRDEFRRCVQFPVAVKVLVGSETFMDNGKFHSLETRRLFSTTLLSGIHVPLTPVVVNSVLQITGSSGD